MSTKDIVSRHIVGPVVLLAVLTAIWIITTERTVFRAPGQNSPVPMGTASASLVRLTVRPLNGYRLEEPHRTNLLRQVTHGCRLKLANEGVIIHALRLRRVARLSALGSDDSGFYEQLLESILDDSKYQRWTPGFALLFDTPYGAGYRTLVRSKETTFDMRAVGGVPHVDKVLSTLGELEVALTAEIVTHSGTHRVLADVLKDSLSRWDPVREAEWTLSAYCDYLTISQREWIDKSGLNRTVDDVLRTVLRKQSVGPCFGTHRFYSLAKACMRARQSPGFFDAGLIEEAEQVLRTLSEQLVENQHQRGSWDPSSVNAADVTWLPGFDPADPALRLVVTGHLLEWFAIADKDLRPNCVAVRKATNFVEEELRFRPETYFNGPYLSPATHAVRALFHLSESS